MYLVKKFFLTALCLFYFCAFAQKTTIYTEPDREFKIGIDLFDKKKFAAGMKSFQNIIESKTSTKDLIRIDAEYYAAACAIELVNKDGEWRMRKFISQHPESNKIKWAYFYLGKSNFRKKKYAETIESLEQVDIYDLSKEDLAELYFKRGYSYLQVGKTDKAKNDLYEIKDVDNKYAKPANYYYSHIMYSEKNYTEALTGFTRLLNDETFGSVVPYYIAQIYYLQGKYDEVIKSAPQLLNDSQFVQKKTEINRIIGESYYHKKNYAEAIPYLLQGVSGTANDNYELGYAYYKINDTQKAISYFEKTTVKEDSLAQNAYTYIADCYLKQGEKNKARSAYYSAYMMRYDASIRENALFNYAKLCYETGFSPYNDAIKYFKQYIIDYPYSSRKNEAYTFLINCFQSTKNYEGAMQTIEQMNSNDVLLKQAYQKLAYFRAITFYNNNRNDSAKKYFLLTSKLGEDPVVSAQSKYWLGEISYQNKEYNNALEIWKSFQLMPGSFQLKEYDGCNYNMGYAYFMNKDYDDAGISFRKYLLNKTNIDATKAADATLRTADCYFMKGSYNSAAEHYETAIAIGKTDIDYAMYQKALCDGLQKNYKEKINGLHTLQQKYPSSMYITQSVFETAESYKALNDNENAITYYKKMIKDYPASPYTQRSIKTIGFLYYNENKNDSAFRYMDRIVKQDPKSDEAKDAVDVIKKIYKEQNKPEEMEIYMSSIGSSVSTDELDESYWQKASDLYYDKKDCDLSMPEMQKYIGKFPNGKYSTEAHFCFAECAYSKENYKDALVAYQYVLSKPRNIRTEASLVKTSYLLYKDKNYAEALPLYARLQDVAESPQNKLTAKLGAMRCAFYTKNYEMCIDECNKVLNIEKIAQQQITEAHQLKAKSLYEMNRRDEAANDFLYVIKNAKNEAGAEAYYYTALTYYQKKEYKETEKTINTLMNYDYSTNDWNTKALLLMSDVYVQKNETTNAEVVLKSIIENADKQEYIDLANQKLQEIKDKKQAEQNFKMQQQEQMQVEFLNKGNDVLIDKMPNNIKTDSLNKNLIQPK
ncbi:MAG: tetratricopeptide repeat protein [Bacteroidetes bacterium]|nr:tetratricopeptide repeat protein [Bacteroidota bacterium]